MLSMLLWYFLGGLLKSAYASSNVSVSALSIPPSLYWEGDDGWWSTFSVQIGTPGQTVRLLPGTSTNAGSTTWVIIPEGCTIVNPNLTSCDNKRGGVFQSNQSLSWSTQGLKTGIDGAIYSLETFEERMLGRDGNGSYGFDTIGLGLPDSGLPIVEKQVVAGIWTDNFFLGSLGISPIPFNFSSLNNPQPSLLGTLRNHSLIPSASWAYTAGAYYQDPPVFGSLTFGGYDTTRFEPNNLTIAFGADFSRDLLVRLHSITYDTIGSSPLLTSSIDLCINSLVTEIWLPVEVCNVFAKQFNLTWNDSGQLYLVDEKVHTALLAQNPTFTFTIGQTSDDRGTIEIVLPYAAFDLNLTAPVVDRPRRYFPLKQAQNSSQYTLGRTFLQEAYVIADYERRNFTVAQALFPATSIPQNIVSIHAPSQDPPANNTTPKPIDNAASRRKKLNAGIIAGIVVACMVVVGVLACVLWRRRRNEAEAEKDSVSSDGTIPPATVTGSGVAEVHGVSTIPPEIAGRQIVEADREHVLLGELQAVDGPHGRFELPTNR